MPPPPDYFPLPHGRYRVSPDLIPFGADLGGGVHDTHLFQIDDRFAHHRAHKLSLTQRLWVDGFDPDTRAAVDALIRARLCAEHPERFHDDGTHLLCRLTGDRLPHIPPPDSGIDPFDALCCQVCEDVAVVRRTPDRGEWNAALHVCAPSHWAPEEKIGRSFAHTHAPVPGMERSRAAGPSLIDRAIARGPFVRFAWGVAFDPAIDQRPGRPAAAFDGRRFWLRVERQVLWPVPEADAMLFTIRVHIVPGERVRADPTRASLLAAALRSMDPEAARYKGVVDAMPGLLALLEGSSGS